MIRPASGGESNAMYIPTHFQEADPAIIERLIRDNGFALLVSGSGDGVVATHLPLTYHPEIGATGVLRGHVARANGQWHDFETPAPALAVFSGPHAYVSPRWYQPGPSVPTWNYEAVHVYGTARLLEGEAALRPILEALAAQYDPHWSMAELPEKYVTGMTRGIVGIEIAIERIEAKRKLSQNRSAADIESVIAALDGGSEVDRALALAMRQAAQKRG
jgi:transcriptional regulator